MSIKIMSWVWENSPYDGKQLLIHLALADWASDEGVCWPNQEKIAAKCRCSVETVRTTTRRMQQDGFLSILEESKGRGSSHRYLLTTPKSSGGSTETPKSKRGNPQTHAPKPPNPSPNNRQEPSKNQEQSSNVVISCPYCKRKVKWGQPHDCSAMNMRMR